MNKTKSFDIPKQLIWKAYKQVRKNKGAPGIDEVSIAKFEERLEDNLYKLWLYLLIYRSSILNLL